MDINQYTKTALKVTSSFEGNDGFATVTGNFDGQGLSAGALQWTVGMGTFQSIVNKTIQGNPGILSRLMPQTGAELQTLLQAPLNEAVSIAASWDDGYRRVKEPYLSELKAFWGSVECITEQVLTAQKLANQAAVYANAWVQLRDEPNAPQDPTVQEFCFFFDVVVNNGSLRGLTYKDVVNFYAANGGPDAAHEVIINWCANASPNESQAIDCIKNSQLWSQMLSTAPDSLKKLWVLGFLRAKMANAQFQALVLNRKGTLALGQGWVNNSLLSFEKMSGLT